MNTNCIKQVALNTVETTFADKKDKAVADILNKVTTYRTERCVKEHGTVAVKEKWSYRNRIRIYLRSRI